MGLPPVPPGAPPPRGLNPLVSFFDGGDPEQKAVALGVGVVVALITVMNTLTVVPASNVAVVTQFGSIAKRTLDAGPHFKSPFARVHLFSLKTLLLDPDFQSVPTREGLTVELDTALLYHIRPEGAREIFQKLG